MDDVSIDLIEHVQLIRINRPRVLNALNQATARVIADAVHAAESDDRIRVSVLTGNADAFSSGADLRALAMGETANVDERGLCGISQARPSKPIVAAVEGWAIGAGLELLLSCDLIVASETAKLGVPEVRRGLVAAGGGALLLPRRIPFAVALELLLVGEPITAERGLDVGLVNAVVPAGTAVERALELARKIAENAPLAVRAAKAIAWQSGDWSAAEMWSRQAALSEPVLRSSDAEEGARAFLEHRDPRWRGS